MQELAVNILKRIIFFLQQANKAICNAISVIHRCHYIPLLTILPGTVIPKLNSYSVVGIRKTIYNSIIDVQHWLIVTL